MSHVPHSYADQLNDMIRLMDKTAEHLATDELYGFADECRSVRNFLVELRDVRLAGPSHSYADVIAKQLGDRAGSWMNVQLSRGEWDEVVALLRLAGPGGDERLRALFQRVDQRADGWNERRDTILNGRIMRDELRWIATELNAILSSTPATTGSNK